MASSLIRFTLSVILSVSLFLTATAQTSVAATSSFGPLTEMVICAHDGGTAVVLIDAQGNPVDPTKPCAHGHCALCSSFGLAGLIPERFQIGVRFAAVPASWPMFPSFVSARDTQPNAARAPPFEI